MMNTKSKARLIGYISASLVFVLITVLTAPPAAALVYWTTFGGDLGKANLDGTVITTALVESSGRPTGIAVDANHIYWTRFGSSAVDVANLDGTSHDDTWITGCSEPNGVAVNANYIYWGNTNSNYIGRADLDGSNIDQEWISGATNPTGIAINAGYIYWTNYNAANSIGRADLDGSNVNDTWLTDCTAPSGIAVDGTYIYWVNYGASGSIGRATLDLVTVDEDFITGISSAIGLAVDANYIYWTTSDDIGRANLDGSGIPDPSWISDIGVSPTRGIAVDATATAVILVNFDARAVRSGIKVRWETEAEIDTAGFHVWRRGAVDKEFVRITEEMIPAQGNPFQGAVYTWQDNDMSPNSRYWYKLEDIDYAGANSLHGPVAAVQKKK